MSERKFAQGTKISSEKSEMDIRKTLKKFGATAYAYYEDDAYIGFLFEYENRRIKITIELPDPEAHEFTHVKHSSGKMLERSEDARLKFWEAECNRRWRALVLTVKAKLITVTEGIRTFEQEFLYDIVLPNGQTVGEYVAPQIEKSLATGKLPPMLPGIGETSKSEN